MTLKTHTTLHRVTYPLQLLLACQEQIKLLANSTSTAATGIPAPFYQFGGYFYPPVPYPPPFAVPPPPPPMGMLLLLPQLGVHTLPPPGVDEAYQHQVVPPTT